MDKYSRNFFQVFRNFTVIGDSLSCGYTGKDDLKVRSIPSKDQETNWPTYIARRTGTELKHLGIGGTTAKSWRETFMELAHVVTDCYIIGIGVNDKRFNLPVGSVSDIVNPGDVSEKGDVKGCYAGNADTFYGNYDFMVRRLLTWNPSCHIFVLTIPGIEEAHIENAETGDGVTEEYNDAIRYIAGQYSSNVHLIDLYQKKEYTEGLIAECSTCGHFTPLAYNYMSTIIEDEICEVMEKNVDKFIVAPYK